ncbi:MAG TPA: hypothetical protein VKP65_07995, partial [Rhodothermales bacterium]|nr:hypothetical protein [Rhodothermales bacterium]
MANNHQDKSFEEAFPTDEERRERMQQSVWSTLGTLYQWRRFISIVVGVVAVLAVIITLMMDNVFRAQARVLLPASGGGGLLSSAIVENLPAAAQSFIGGSGGDYTRYLSVLTSRTMYERVVERFDLIQVYETHESETAEADAVSMLADNTEFLVDTEFEHLTIAVKDTDPERAAAMTNYYVDQLTLLNAQLSAQSATQFRKYVEQRHDETLARLDSVLLALRDFQQKYGVMELQAQGELFLEFTAELRIEAARAELQYETLLSQYGPDNSLVKAARQTATSANRTYQRALSGGESLMPVAKENLPQVSLEYIELERERMIQQTLLEYIRPALEEARFEEERQVEAV